MIDPYSIIVRPMLTEKGTRLKEERNQIMFEVHLDSTKQQIKEAVESIFKVKVEKVHTLRFRGKSRRTRYGWTKKPNWKKAIATLKEGSRIDLVEGL